MEELPQPIKSALEFEKLNYVRGSVTDDAFYNVPDGAADIAAGTLIKVEKEVDASQYLLPPATSLSRIVYQSESLNGRLLPVSAFILWPFSPTRHEDGYPLVAWAHGTSGLDKNSAPSHMKNLWHPFIAPYQLALQGFVVVATDYAGLGVSEDAEGKPIVHEFLAGPSHANDIVYSVIASQSAFPELSKQFTVIGHSQGGGAAWAVAQRQAHKPVEGLLGAIAVSPVTNLLDEFGTFAPIIKTAVCQAIAATVPGFELSAVLTEEGMRRFGTLQSLSAGAASALALLWDADLLKPGWEQNDHVRAFQDRVSNGGKPLGTPLLVIHGESDPQLSISTTTKAVENTINQHPSSQLEYISLPNVTHVPVLFAAQRVWMQWISDRFAGTKVKDGYTRSRMEPARPAKSYQTEQNWYLAPATEFFHAP